MGQSLSTQEAHELATEELGSSICVEYAYTGPCNTFAVSVSSSFPHGLSLDGPEVSRQDCSTNDQMLTMQIVLKGEQDDSIEPTIKRALERCYPDARILPTHPTDGDTDSHVQPAVSPCAHLSPLLSAVASSRALFLFTPVRLRTLSDILHHQRTSENQLLTELEKHFFTYQLLQTVAFCHANGVAHGDLQPRCIVLNSHRASPGATTHSRTTTAPMGDMSNWNLVGWHTLKAGSRTVATSADHAQLPERATATNDCTPQPLTPPAPSTIHTAPSEARVPILSGAAFYDDFYTGADDLASLVEEWCCGKLSNFDYLMALNKAAGRIPGCPQYHPVLPWVIDFAHDPTAQPVPQMGWRDLSVSKCRLNKGEEVLDLTFEASLETPHHLSDVVSDITYYMYLARRTPIPVLQHHVRAVFRPNEYPPSMERMYQWTPDECIPEFFMNPDVFQSLHPAMPDLSLPSWAGSAREFLDKHRAALESERVSVHLHHWIDLVFGYQVTGSAAMEAKNVIFQDPMRLRTVQLFAQPHPRRVVTDQSLRTPRLRRSLGNLDHVPPLHLIPPGHGHDRALTNDEYRSQGSQGAQVADIQASEHAGRLRSASVNVAREMKELGTGIFVSPGTAIIDSRGPQHSPAALDAAVGPAINKIRSLTQTMTSRGVTTYSEDAVPPGQRFNKENDGQPSRPGLGSLPSPVAANTPHMNTMSAPHHPQSHARRRSSFSASSHPPPSQSALNNGGSEGMPLTGRRPRDGLGGPAVDLFEAGSYRHGGARRGRSRSAELFDVPVMPDGDSPAWGNAGAPTLATQGYADWIANNEPTPLLLHRHTHHDAPGDLLSISEDVHLFCSKALLHEGCYDDGNDADTAMGQCLSTITTPSVDAPPSSSEHQFADACAKDMFSLACIIVEVYTGAPLFTRQTRDLYVLPTQQKPQHQEQASTRTDKSSTSPSPSGVGPRPATTHYEPIQILAQLPAAWHHAVSSMINRDSAKRSSASELLTSVERLGRGLISEMDSLTSSLPSSAVPQDELALLLRPARRPPWFPSYFPLLFDFLDVVSVHHCPDASKRLAVIIQHVLKKKILSNIPRPAVVVAIQPIVHLIRELVPVIQACLASLGPVLGRHHILPAVVDVLSQTHPSIQRSFGMVRALVETNLLRLLMRGVGVMSVVESGMVTALLRLVQPRDTSLSNDVFIPPLISSAAASSLVDIAKSVGPVVAGRTVFQPLLSLLSTMHGVERILDNIDQQPKATDSVSRTVLEICHLFGEDFASTLCLPFIFHLLNVHGTRAGRGDARYLTLLLTIVEELIPFLSTPTLERVLLPTQESNALFRMLLNPSPFPALLTRLASIIMRLCRGIGPANTIAKILPFIAQFLASFDEYKRIEPASPATAPLSPPSSLSEEFRTIYTPPLALYFYSELNKMLGRRVLQTELPNCAYLEGMIKRYLRDHPTTRPLTGTYQGPVAVIPATPTRQGGSLYSPQGQVKAADIRTSPSPSKFVGAAKQGDAHSSSSPIGLYDADVLSLLFSDVHLIGPRDDHDDEMRAGAGELNREAWSFRGDIIRSFTGHGPGGVHSLASHASESLFISGGGDGHVKVWRLDSLRPLVSYDGHTSDEAVHGVSFLDPLGSKVVSCGASMHVWDAERGVGLGATQADSPFRAMSIFNVHETATPLVVCAVPDRLFLYDIREPTQRGPVHVATRLHPPRWPGSLPSFWNGGSSLCSGHIQCLATQDHNIMVGWGSGHVSVLDARTGGMTDVFRVSEAAKVSHIDILSSHAHTTRSPGLGRLAHVVVCGGQCSVFPQGGQSCSPLSVASTSPHAPAQAQVPWQVVRAHETEIDQMATHGSTMFVASGSRIGVTTLGLERVRWPVTTTDTAWVRTNRLARRSGAGPKDTQRTGNYRITALDILPRHQMVLAACEESVIHTVI